jgi:hypothetical protein
MNLKTVMKIVTVAGTVITIASKVNDALSKEKDLSSKSIGELIKIIADGLVH